MELDVKQLDSEALKREKARLLDRLLLIDQRIAVLAGLEQGNRFGELYGCLSNTPAADEDEITAVRDSASDRANRILDEVRP